MSVTVTACYLVNIIIDIVLIFLISINVIEFDEIKTSKKNAVEQCNSLNPLVTALIFCLEIFILIYSHSKKRKKNYSNIKINVSLNSNSFCFVFNLLSHERWEILIYKLGKCLQFPLKFASSNEIQSGVENKYNLIISQRGSGYKFPLHSSYK